MGPENGECPPGLHSAAECGTGRQPAVRAQEGRGGPGGYTGSPRTVLEALRRLGRTYGPDLRGAGRFRLLGWPEERATGARLVVDLWQVLGTRRWSLAVVHIVKNAEELD